MSMQFLRRLLSTHVPKPGTPNAFFIKNFRGEVIPSAARNAFEANAGTFKNWLPREAAPGALNQMAANAYVRHGHGPGRLAKRQVQLRPSWASRY